NVDQTEVTTCPYVSTYVRDYLLANGGKGTRNSADICTENLTAVEKVDDEGKPYIDYVCNGEFKSFQDEFKGDFLTYNLNLGWSYNTLNRPMFPTTGMSHRVNGEIALPGSDVEYQKVTYDAQAFFPLGRDVGLRCYGKLGYRNDLLFYKNVYLGCFGSVRGYENSSYCLRYPGVSFQEGIKIDPSKR